jgi:multidrug resistance efflux pump
MRARRIVPLVLAVMAACGGGVVLAVWWRKPLPQVEILGMVRQTEIRIVAETTGRVGRLAAAPGQHVRKGDLLAVLDNPELAASLTEARAAAASARADRDRVRSGVRAEEVAIAEQGVHTAEANLVLARQQFARAAALAARSVASRQQLDESTASLAKAEADLDLKRAQFDAAKAGPIALERALADGKVALADATVLDLQASFDKTKVLAPADGLIGIQVAEPGEVMSPGRPIMTLQAEGDQWFAFTLREDFLEGIDVGRTVVVTTDNGHRIQTRATELRPLGEFATWRAARAVGDHDLNSLQLRLDPVSPPEGLRPGMTVWLQGRP